MHKQTDLNARKQTRVNSMATMDNSQLTDDPAHQAIGPVQPEVGDLLGIARRGWLFVIAGTTFGLICALMILAVVPPTYKASSRIVFERTVPRYMQTNKVTNEPIIDDYDAMGQSYVISSESILLHVVRSLSLASDPDFVGDKNSPTLGSRVRGLFRNTAQALGLVEKQAGDQSNDSHMDPEKIALDGVVRNLTVSREDVASVITIAFSWKDPVKAATIVNAIVDTYIQAGIANKIKSTNVAGKVVQERVEELKQQAKDAERAANEYRAANNVGTGKVMLSDSLQASLTNARVAMVEARARAEWIAKDPDAAALFVADNEIYMSRKDSFISKLRADLQDLSIRANEVEARVGKDHLAAVKIHKRMDELREAIANEQRRISESFVKDYELARAKYEQLSASISRAMGEEGANSDVQARMRDLDSAADTLRGLYNRMLQQVGEMNRVEAQPSITPDARVLSRADPPLQTESSKKRLLIIASGSLMGLLLGGAILLIRDFPFGVFRTSQQVTYATGLPCVVLPKIVSTKGQASLMAGEYALDAPYSRIAQSLRSLGAMIGIAQRETDVKVVCVVSSNPGEGKTTVAINLAAQFGRHTNTRVLLIDGDFYRQSLTKIVAPDARVGLREALEEPTALAKLVVRKERLNLDALPCPVPAGTLDPAELLGIAEMERLIEVARQAYDLVIIEAPPMAAIVDYKIIARPCDGFVFVVEWGKTSQRLVQECLSDASAILDRILCVVLNKADPSALRSIEHYKGDRFHAYYSDQKAA
jgi:succinoglycan biosynthesis transport protein ExoP